jgi:nitrate reductase gamma subunit
MNPIVSFFFSVFAILIILLLAWVGVGSANMYYLFGVIIPYAAIFTFIVGFIVRMVQWAKVPVPFRIPTTCGQEKSLPWIKANELESPTTTFGVVKRMALEVLFFRSLFRNTNVELKEGPRVVYWSAKWLWLGGLAFHWSFLVIVTRHLRFFTEPIPFFVHLADTLDGLLEITVPTLYLTDAVLVGALTYLVLRRILAPKVRYISLAADYFPLLLIISVALSGVLMRHIWKVDLISIKALAMGLVSFNPVLPEGIGVIFYIHLFLVCVLISYFPFSKLMHMGGVFLSPTRNLANTNRSHRHRNPWDYPVKVHSYEEYEDEFRDKMKMAEIPVEKE